MNFTEQEIFEQIGRLYMANIKLTAALVAVQEEDEPDGG